MDFDSAYIDPLITDWMENLQQSLKEHIALHSIVGPSLAFSALQGSVIQQFFNIATFLNLEPNIKWLAIQLYDLYVIKRFASTFELARLHNSLEMWTRFVEESARKINLHVLSCFKIASKLESHSHCLRLPQFYETLRMMGDRTEYSPSMIFSSEIEVFKQIGFKVSFCTPLQCLEILLAATGLINTPNTYNIATKILDIAYLRHETIYSEFCLRFIIAHQVNTEFMEDRVLKLKQNMLHMCSAILSCATAYLGANISEINEQVLILKLAEFSNTSYADIMIMANLSNDSQTQSAVSLGDIDPDEPPFYSRRPRFIPFH